jgi:uncharacterized protein YcnI
VGTQPSPPAPRRRWLAQGLALFATVVITWLAATSPAAGHVVIDDAVPADDGSATVSFTFDHGCADSPTTALAVRTPEGASVRSTTQPEGWTSEVAEGRVDWAGPPIADHEPARFTMTLTLTAQPGETVAFPTVQRCVQGEEAWIDLDPASSNPAPSLVATTAIAAAPDPQGAQPAPDGPDGAGSDQVALVIAVGTALGAAAGAGAGARRRG